MRGRGNRGVVAPGLRLTGDDGGDGCFRTHLYLLLLPRVAPGRSRNASQPEALHPERLPGADSFRGELPVGECPGIVVWGSFTGGGIEFFWCGIRRSIRFGIEGRDLGVGGAGRAGAPHPFGGNDGICLEIDRTNTALSGKVIQSDARSVIASLGIRGYFWHEHDFCLDGTGQSKIQNSPLADRFSSAAESNLPTAVDSLSCIRQGTFGQHTASLTDRGNRGRGCGG